MCLMGGKMFLSAKIARKGVPTAKHVFPRALNFWHSPYTAFPKPMQRKAQKKPSGEEVKGRKKREKICIL